MDMVAGCRCAVRLRKGVVGFLVAALAATGAVAAEIHEAAESQNIGRVRELLAENPECVNVGTARGFTALHLAAGVNNTNLMEILVGAGADVNSKTIDGLTPLHWAAYMNASNAVQWLSARGADRNARTRDGRTPLEMANKVASYESSLVLTGAGLGTASNTIVAKPLPGKAGAGLVAADQAREAGRMEEAYESLSELVRAHPEDLAINYSYGLTCMAMGDVARAQLAFERIVDMDPGNDRARYELARTYCARGQYDIAEMEFKKVLASNPPEAVKANVEALLAEVRKTRERWSWQFRVDGGVMSDDNVNVGPNSERIAISPIFAGSVVIRELTLGPESEPLSANGSFGSAAAGVARDIGAAGGWDAGLDVSAYKNMLSDAEAYESGSYHAEMSARNRTDSSLLRVPVGITRVTLGGESVMDIVGIAPSVAYSPLRSGDRSYLFEPSVMYHDYVTLNERDAVHVSLGGAVRQAFAERAHAVTLAAGYHIHDVDLDVYAYNGLELMAGADFTLPYESTMYASCRILGSEYKGHDVFAVEDRSDKTLVLSTGVRHYLGKGWGVDLGLQMTDNRSSFDLYEYKRKVATASIGYTF